MFFFIDLLARRRRRHDLEGMHEVAPRRTCHKALVMLHLIDHSIGSTVKVSLQISALWLLLYVPGGALAAEVTHGGRGLD